MKIPRKIKKNQKPLLIICGVILVALISYFLFLLKQVETAFDSPAEFIPTRIYSSVEKIAPPMARGSIERKLKALGYTVSTEGSSISFILHSPQYPDYLIPENHVTFDLKDKKLTLRFEGSTPNSSLESIESPSGAVNDFYLEPEFVATLSSDKSQIREVLKFEEFPKGIPDGVMAAEDQHFYEHFGIDPRGFVRAILVNLKTLSFSQGGSTITQQLVKNLM
jgi:penicillin-binding protein 1B